MPEAPRILVSNDDGHASEGIRSLVAALEPLGEVFVCAPEAEQSAAAHSISLYRPLRIREIRPRWYAVDGTPTDCSWIGINHILKGRKPALMVSGINHGPNLADDVTYSGTVAAAMEASLLAFPPSRSAWRPGAASTSAPPPASHTPWSPRRCGSTACRRTCC
jgi:5'-nucleotidase